MYRLLFDDGSGSKHDQGPFPSIEDAQAEAEDQFGGPLWWETPTRGRHPAPGQWAGEWTINEEEDSMTEQTAARQQPDLQAMIADQIKDALGQLAQAPAQTFEEAVASLDPADSDAALEMLDFLLKTGRLQRVGVLDGGQGYLFMYQEPKGSSKQGYRPGGTQGDRIVDEALKQQRETGTKAGPSGMCPHCFSAVREVDGVIVNDLSGDPECPGTGDKHAMA